MHMRVGKTSIVEKEATFGDNVFVDQFSFVGSGAKLGNNVRIGRYCEIRSSCVVGDGTSFGSRCTLSAGTVVGKNCVVKYGFVSTDTPVLNKNDKTVGAIGDGVMIGANVTLMPGVSIGDGALIGACSLLTKDVPAGEVWAGSPARFFRKVRPDETLA
jgi:acetyltransferase-like isoleucine patch superfamily enzyme